MVRFFGVYLGELNTLKVSYLLYSLSVMKTNKPLVFNYKSVPNGIITKNTDDYWLFLSLYVVSINGHFKPVLVI